MWCSHALAATNRFAQSVIHMLPCGNWSELLQFAGMFEQVFKFIDDGNCAAYC